MDNSFFGTINYLTPYHRLNTIKNYKLNDSMLYNNFLSNSFSLLGYQIMNPYFISYKLEPIYSSFPSIECQKSYSYNKIPKIEIGRPVETNNSQINQRYNYSYNITDSTSRYSNNVPTAEKINYKSDTQLILDAINKLKRSSRNYTNHTSSTKEYTSYKDENNKIEDKKPNFIKLKKVSPFNDTYRKKNQPKKKGEKLFSRGEMKVEVSPIIKLYGNINKKNVLKKNVKRNWFDLFKNFISIYTFFSSAKKYSSIYSQAKNKSIYIRTKHIVKEVAILKDWIISIEESFFNEFQNYEDFNSRLNLKIQGEKSQILKKSILNIINLFIDNLESNLENIPENVQSILFEYIKNKCYFPKKYLSKFQINRLDFNFNGSIKNITITQCAMIISYLIINGICVQQILLHLKDVFTEYSKCEDMNLAIKNISSILHYLVIDIFKKKQKKINDILALFNYYRSYHLYNEQIEKYKNKMNNKINSKIEIEENDNDDEYNGLLLSYKEVKEFFDENNKTFEKFKDAIYDWSIELAKNIKNKFKNKEKESNKDDISLNRRKRRKIKSTIHG